jgi:uncharacterized protein (DUF362 family)
MWATLGSGDERMARAVTTATPIYIVRNIPVPDRNVLRHPGVDALLNLLGADNRKFYQSRVESALSGPNGMIASDDIVLVKVNAQWKYRGCTNSDVVKGVVQRILEHPDGFEGEVVVFENGQGRGCLDCATQGGGTYPDATRHANAEDESQSFSYLADTTFAGQPVSEYLLDCIRSNFISADDHSSQGYRKAGNVSYPCFTTRNGRRIELRDGEWTSSGYADKLKLINIPVLKHHGGCGTTGALKHFYGILSMDDGRSGPRHYSDIGNDCVDMWCDVKTPVLTILDCIWISPGDLSGYPESKTVRTNLLLAGFDPVALDYWASKNVMFATDQDPYHDPDQSAELGAFLTQAMNRINMTSGGVDGRPATMTETDMRIVEHDSTDEGEGEGEGEGEASEGEGEGQSQEGEGEGEGQPASSFSCASV